jgi:HK97 family phage prohead protease
MEEQLYFFGENIKLVGNTVQGYLVRFGNPNDTDLEGDYFTKDTDFGRPLKEGQKFALNLYYHHGQDKTIGTKNIGSGFVKMDEKGLWYEAQIEMNDQYNQMIMELAKQGKLGYSSGAASHMVERKSVGNAYEIKRWTLAEASLTPRPAESRNIVTAKMLKAMVEDLKVGDYVSWYAYGTTVRGQIIKIRKDGPLVGQPLGTTIVGTEEDPVYKIRVYQKQPDGSYQMRNATSVHRASALTKIEKPYKEVAMNCPECGKVVTSDYCPDCNIALKMCDMCGKMYSGEDCKMCKPQKDSGEEEAPIMPENPFYDVEKELVSEGLETLFERVDEAVLLYLEGENVDLNYVFDQFAVLAKDLVAKIEAKSTDVAAEMKYLVSKESHRPTDVRDAEKTLREAMCLSRSEAKKLANVLWTTLCDANDTKEEVIETKTVEAEQEVVEDNSNIKLMLLKKAMLDLIGD